MKDSKTCYQSIRKRFCITIAVCFLAGLFSSYAFSAMTDETTKPGARLFDLRAIFPYFFPHISCLLRRAEGRLAPRKGRRPEVLSHPKFQLVRTDALKGLLDQFTAEFHRQQG